MIRANAASRTGVNIPFVACAPGSFRHSTPERALPSAGRRYMALR